MILPRKGDKVVTLVETPAASDIGFNKSIDFVENIQQGRTGIVVSVSTNAACDGRIVCVSFDGEFRYVREDCLKIVQ
jgi:hypothetical protein